MRARALVVWRPRRQTVITQIERVANSVLERGRHQMTSNELERTHAAMAVCRPPSVGACYSLLWRIERCDVLLRTLPRCERVSFISAKYEQSAAR